MDRDSGLEGSGNPSLRIGLCSGRRVRLYLDVGGALCSTSKCHGQNVGLWLNPPVSPWIFILSSFPCDRLLFSTLLSFFGPIVVLKSLSEGPSRKQARAPSEFARIYGGTVQKVLHGRAPCADLSKEWRPAGGLKGEKGQFLDPRAVWREL